MIPIKIERREPIMHWIPCSERLPEEGEEEQWLITCDNNGDVDMNIFHDGQFSKWDREPLNVVAWMPLPEPYKGEADG